MTAVTRLLDAAAAGDPRAAADLLPLVYDELRALAAARLAAERPGQTLQATALVHEAYLRLAGGGDAGATVAPGPDSADDVDLEALSDALDELAAVSPPAAAVVKLRFFAGLTNKDAAAAVGVSPPEGRPALGVRPGLAPRPAGRPGRLTPVSRAHPAPGRRTGGTPPRAPTRTRA